MKRLWKWIPVIILSTVLFISPRVHVCAYGAASDYKVDNQGRIFGYDLIMKAGPWVDACHPAFGAKGDGITDDTAAIQSALNAAAGVGPLYLGKGKSFRITHDLSMLSDTTIEGEGELYIDYRSVGYGGMNRKVLSAEGTLGNSVNLTQDVATSDTKAVLADASGFAAGDYVALGDTRYRGVYPVQILLVKSVTGGRDINLFSPVNVAYTVANGAYVKKIRPKSNITIKDITVRFSATSDTEIFFQAYCAVNVLVKNVKLTGQRGSSNPGATHGLTALYCHNVRFEGNILRALVSDGDGIFADGCQSAIIANNTTSVYRFGIGLFNLYAGEANGNILHGPRLSGGRGIKLDGTTGCNVNGNRIHSFDTALKIEDSGYNNLVNNICFDNGVGTSGASVINIGKNLSDGTPCAGNIVTNNRIYNCSQNGIYTDVFAPYTIISENQIFNAGGIGILVQANSCTITKNVVIGFLNVGIAFAQCSVVTGNFVYTSTNTIPSFSTTGTFLPVNAGPFSGNVASNNPFDSAKSADLAKLLAGINNIKDLGHRTFYGTAVPTAGTWKLGDRVINTAPAEAGSAGSKYVVEGWVCTAAGDPGKWLQMRALTGN